MRAEVYSRELKLRDGKKVPAIVAADMALLSRALKGDHRAAQIVFKTAKELGVLDGSSDGGRNATDLSDDELRNMSDEDLSELVKIVRRTKGDSTH